MKKIYFNDNGWVCGRYPYNFKIENENNFVEVNDTDFEKTLSCQEHFAWKVVNGSLVEERYEKDDTKETLKQKMSQLKSWFDTYYTQHEQKYNRLIALERECDDGSDPADKLIELYQEAERNRKKIQELEKMLGE